MRAAARIVAEATAGTTRLAVLRGESPLLPRRTGPPTRATVHLVGGAAGPLRGDDLLLEIEVGPGADLEIRSVAATLLLPGRPAPPSRLVVRATVAGTLRWLPEPTIAAAGCDHHAITEVDVAEGGTLLWRDDLVCGRHNEPSGAVRADTTVRYAGRTLYRHRLTVGPDAPGWSGAAVLGHARATGSVIMTIREQPGHEMPDQATPHQPTPGQATPGRARPIQAWPGRAKSSQARSGHEISPQPHLPAETAAVMRLAGPGLLATAVGRDIREVRAALDPFCAPSRPTCGRPAENVVPPAYVGPTQ